MKTASIKDLNQELHLRNPGELREGAQGPLGDQRDCKGGFTYFLFLENL